MRSETRRQSASNSPQKAVVKPGRRQTEQRNAGSARRDPRERFGGSGEAASWQHDGAESGARED
jgi:hypothetical protein